MARRTKATKTKTKPKAPEYKRNRSIRVCYNCAQYKRADQTCHARAADFLPTRNDAGPDFTTIPRTQPKQKPKNWSRPEEAQDNPALWGVWPHVVPDDFCGEFEPRPAGKLQRPD